MTQYPQAESPLSRRTCRSTLLALALVLGGQVIARGNGGVTFTDIAADPAAGLTYQRAPSASAATMDALRQQSRCSASPGTSPPKGSSGRVSIACPLPWR